MHDATFAHDHRYTLVARAVGDPARAHGLGMARTPVAGGSMGQDGDVGHSCGQAARNLCNGF